jgi:hypothetical protein
MFEEEINAGAWVEYVGGDPIATNIEMVGVRAKVLRSIPGNACELDYKLNSSSSNYKALKRNLRLIAPPKHKWRV